MRRSIVVEAFGGPEVLNLVSEESLPLPEHSVRIQIKACGVNRADVLLRSGSYHGVKAPARPGIEASGEVVESASERFPVGSRAVIFANRTGLYTTETVSGEREICAIPDGVSFEQAAALPINWLTAWRCLHALIRLQAEDTILIPAAASGVGTAAIQIARHVGATIIAAAGSPEKLSIAKELGAHFVVNYREMNLPEAVCDLTQGKGVSAFLDTVGGAIFSAGLKTLAPFGRVAALANVTLEDSLINTRDFYPKNAEIYGFQFGKLLAAGRYDPAPDMMHILNLVANGVFTPYIAQTLPLTDSAKAHRFLESREVIGKLLLIP